MPSTPKPSASRQARVAKPAGGAARRQPSRGSGRPPGKAPTKPAGRGGRRAAGRSAELALLGALRRGLYVVVLLSVGLVGGGFAVLNSVEIPAPVRTLKTTSLVCLSDVADGACGQSNSVARFFSGENRVNVKLSEMSQTLIDAVVAGEDRSYFRHAGVDPTGIARALYQDVRGSGVQQGGSTITQQYVKNVYLTSERTITRKMKEAAIALKLERKFSKAEILERYLNEVYFGRSAYGVAAAARTYFGKEASQLDVAESAYLAGLLRAPEKADAERHPDEATRRRHTVLVAMLEEQYISKAQFDEADRRPWEGHVAPRRANTTGTEVTADFESVGGRYVMEWVRKQLIAMPSVGENALFGKGLKVYLTINPNLQREANAAVTSTLSNPETDPSASLVSLDKEGRIIAMIGGQDFEKSQVNLALGRAGGGSGRGAGSTFKAIALAEYVRQGNSVKSEIAAPPVIVFPKANDGKDWEVKNFEDEDLGVTTIDNATWHSSNTAYAQIMRQIKPAGFAEMAAKLGITAPVKKVQSSVLGTTDVSPLEMATAYSTFANRGVRNQPWIIRRVENAQGEVIYDGAANRASERAIDEGVADTVNSVLTGVIKSGTGKGAGFRRTAAGKTGTTQDFKDAWFVGYTCSVTTSVWMGYQGDGTSVPTMENVRGKKVTGGSFPADIWRNYMKVANQDAPDCEFPPTDAGKTVGVADPKYTTTSSTSSTTSSTLPSTTTTTIESTPTTASPKPTSTAAPTTAAPGA